MAEPSAPEDWSPFGALAVRLPAAAAEVTLSVLPTPATFLLLGDIDEPGWRDAIAGAAGVAPSRTVGAVATGADRRMLTLGPDMWLLLCDAPAAGLGQALLDAAGRFARAGAVETTETRVWLRLEGGGAATALAKLATLDLAPAAFPPGCVYGARLGALACLLERRADDIFVVAGPTSSAEYLAGMLLDAIGAGPT